MGNWKVNPDYGSGRYTEPKVLELGALAAIVSDKDICSIWPLVNTEGQLS
jgi:hypothetical protein